MEGQIPFDLWGKVTASDTGAAADLMQRHMNISRLEALKTISNSRRNSESIRLANNLGWAECEDIAAAFAPFAADLEIYQEDYGPQDKSMMSYCPIHHIYYGGCLGCPICDGVHRP